MLSQLAFEQQRLFLVLSGTHAGPALIDPADRVRALVLELTRPPEWSVLGRVWQGVQADLGLPAPGIAVSGVDAMQLWFSLAEPVPAARARAFLEGLQRRFLADVDARRVRLWPAVQDVASSARPVHAALVPARQASGDWSAFVAPDLAPVFGDTPWLDIPPNEEGQANLLRALEPMAPADFEAALAALANAAEEGALPPAASETAATPSPAHGGPSAPQGRASAPAAAVTDHQEQARLFLRQVMQDEGVALALRIEAAKALLQPGR
ncbi:hypothetical protein [Xenophilus sp. Marseille-Q4582]|uniref:hypothetical protein n=1 Tax=Xenophilus sp. Marseille-Q4582 TaxID=2866600 RepID=UPI001CE3CBAE|nr:hypothetical protein [Xenophilus sp. Marseille-Q4582]